MTCPKHRGGGQRATPPSGSSVHTAEAWSMACHGTVCGRKAPTVQSVPSCSIWQDKATVLACYPVLAPEVTRAGLAERVEPVRGPDLFVANLGA